ncbi:MAG: SAF domain-containing protein [Chloroflexota bacterium]
MKANRLLLIYGAIALTLFGVMIVATAFTPRYYGQSYYDAQTEFASPLVFYPTEVPLVEQVIAVQEILAGQIIPPEAVALQSVPVDYAVRGGYSSLTDVVGKAVQYDIRRQQTITDHLLQTPEAPDDARATATAYAANNTPTPTRDYANAFISTPTPQLTVRLVVPVHDISAGTVIHSSDLISVEILANSVPFSAITTASNAVGKIARDDLPRNTPILTSMLLEFDSNGTPSARMVAADACRITGNASGSTLYNTPDDLISSGRLRPDLEGVAVRAEEGRYLIALPGGYEVGWVNRGDVQTSGNCDDL